MVFFPFTGFFRKLFSRAAKKTPAAPSLGFESPE
jgi:hypothetical protein